MQITSPDELLNATMIAIDDNNSRQTEAIQAIATYKWYNYYQHIHIKQGSIDDELNENLFEEIKIYRFHLHTQIEDLINGYIDRLNSDIDD